MLGESLIRRYGLRVCTFLNGSEFPLGREQETGDSSKAPSCLPTTPMTPTGCVPPSQRSARWATPDRYGIGNESLASAPCNVRPAARLNGSILCISLSKFRHFRRIATRCEQHAIYLLAIFTLSPALIWLPS